MMKLLSCNFNMDTNRVEAKFADGVVLAIDCLAIEDESETKTLTSCFGSWKMKSRTAVGRQI